jgi:hypothetical protein
VRAPVGKTGLGEAETRENQRKVNALRPSSHAANSLQRLFRGSSSESLPICLVGNTRNFSAS